MAKTFRCISIFLIVLNVQLNLSFAAKRDVQDPVLREIINEFGIKIPKFTNKYGEDVFVQEGSVTRADLLIALYEYNKMIKGAATPAGINQQTVSKNEFDTLKNKVALLEKNGLLANGKNKENTDIVKLIADLEPNMPMLLDNSLRNSKVFNDLQQQVKDGKGPDEDPSKESFSDRKSGHIEKNPGKELSEIKKTLSQLQLDYVSLSKRIDNLSPPTFKVEQMKNTHTQYNNFGSSSGYNKNTGKLVGVSLWLSMLAVLFVSR
jgi:hypothetical protein